MLIYVFQMVMNKPNMKNKFFKEIFTKILRKIYRFQFKNNLFSFIFLYLFFSICFHLFCIFLSVLKIISKNFLLIAISLSLLILASLEKPAAISLSAISSMHHICIESKENDSLAILNNIAYSLIIDYYNLQNLDDNNEK